MLTPRFRMIFVPPQSLKSKVMAGIALIAGGALAILAVVTGDTTNAGIFFGAGALILVAGLNFGSVWLAKISEGGALRQPKTETTKSKGLA